MVDRNIHLWHQRHWFHSLFPRVACSGAIFAFPAHLHTVWPLSVDAVTDDGDFGFAAARCVDAHAVRDDANGLRRRQDDSRENRGGTYGQRSSRRSHIVGFVRHGDGVARLRRHLPDVVRKSPFGRQSNIPRRLHGRCKGGRNDKDARKSGTQAGPGIQDLPIEDRLDRSRNGLLPVRDQKAVLKNGEAIRPEEEVDLVTLPIDQNGGWSKHLEEAGRSIVDVIEFASIVTQDDVTGQGQLDLGSRLEGSGEL